MQDVKVLQFRNPEKSVNVGVVIFLKMMILQIGGYSVPI